MFMEKMDGKSGESADCRPYYFIWSQLQKLYAEFPHG